MPEEEIRVDAYSGSRGEEVPRSFILNEKKVVINKVLGMWIEEDVSGGTRKRCFRIEGSDGHTRTLAYDDKKGEWTLRTAS